MNYYELLELSPSASVEVIRNAYKTLAKKYHPDTYKGNSAFAEEKMKLLNEAISVLEDGDKRMEYDRLNGINTNYGRDDMLGVDENGESIFFSDGSDDSDMSYMDAIDIFIENEPAKKPRKKHKAKKTNKTNGSAGESDDIIGDIVDDISAINDEKYGDGSVKPDGGQFEFEDTDEYEVPDDYEEGETEESDFKTFNVRRGKSKNKTLSRDDKIYYIIVAFLVTSIVVLGALIIMSVNFNNMGNLFSGGGRETPAENTGDTENPGGSKEQTSDTPGAEFITNEPATNSGGSGTTNPTEPTATPTSPATPEPAASATTPESTTTEPATVTEEPATSEPTEEKTEETTPEPTIAPETEEEETEEIVEPEEPSVPLAPGDFITDAAAPDPDSDNLDVDEER